MEKKQFSNTLLGYFKSDLYNNYGRKNLKGFTRQFLAVYISDYNRALKTGINDFTATAATDFYKNNGGTYCAFLESWSNYKKGMQRLEGLTK